MAGDPYRELGISPDASDAEFRAAYRRLVKLHHPDHNAGSPESTRRFEAIQEAYAEVQRRRAGTAGGPGAPPRTPPPRESHATPPPQSDPNLDRRLADMEKQVRKAREKAQRAARKAAREAEHAARAATGAPSRPTDEELGYYTTDDSLAKILADARTELSQRYGEARGHPVARRVSDLISGLEELSGMLDRSDAKRDRR